MAIGNLLTAIHKVSKGPSTLQLHISAVKSNPTLKTTKTRGICCGNETDDHSIPRPSGFRETAIFIIEADRPHLQAYLSQRERYSKKGLIGNTKAAGQNLVRNLSLMLRVWLLKSELTMETINMPSG